MAHGLKLPQKHNWNIKIYVLVVLVVALCVSFFLAYYTYYTSGKLPFNVSISSLQANSKLDQSDISTNDISSYSVQSTEPKYIILNQDKEEKARVLKGGLDSNNMLKLPPNIHDVMWYEKSATPGQGYGVVVINGVSRGTNAAGTFSALKDLNNGDSITIVRGDNKNFIYTVEESQSMSLNDVIKSGLNTAMKPLQSGEEGLTLITDDGTWIPAIQQFNKRRIVRATLSE